MSKKTVLSVIFWKNFGKKNWVKYLFNSFFIYTFAM